MPAHHGNESCCLYMPSAHLLLALVFHSHRTTPRWLWVGSTDSKACKMWCKLLLLNANLAANLEDLLHRPSIPNDLPRLAPPDLPAQALITSMIVCADLFLVEIRPHTGNVLCDGIDACNQASPACSLQGRAVQRLHGCLANVCHC
jgi:hypothetical protein